ncbi:MAG: hypothetical protein ABS87_00995 [Sphingomonas sp. SCN 67-18]|nr:hypothetical protein [Sphingomonas sp. SCN 67-18]ODU22775.1 MAG: hypothetical protein ABS87_00995 [Sphingomonas sp. SCN 67-18]
MIFDRTGLLSWNQAITASAASENVIDLGQSGKPIGSATALARDIGPGTGVPLYVGVTEAFNTLTSLTVTIQTDDNEGFSSPTTVWTSPAYTLAQLAVGAKFMLPDEFPVGTNERYVRLYYTVAGSAPSTGKITAGVVAARQTNSGRY